ncbi:hypothetical protein BMS3Abin07_01127 [bacterium BMS3Abin07]|nr:hypothetical protein BMS3Abin07_01127 [bacterium BMS3Abin07]HDZ88096.1 hypothetical protein [Nitrospirota bacterium]
MKAYNEKDIKVSEIMQLIILHSLYALKESGDVFFQGGTAIRWCYSGMRFSEDLDFVTHLEKDHLCDLLNKISGPVRKGMIAHFGNGEFEVSTKKTSRPSSYIAFFRYRPINERKKFSVKIEFERLKKNRAPQTQNMILYTLPLVSSLITAGEFRIPNAGSILLVETKEEILSDKIRALLEREYLKGRDFYDIWYLSKLNGVRCAPDMVLRKMSMYTAPFTPRRSVDDFLRPGKKERQEMIAAIRQDLSRFLPPEEFVIFETGGFSDFFDALKVVFTGFKSVDLVPPEEKT